MSALHKFIDKLFPSRFSAKEQKQATMYVNREMEKKQEAADQPEQEEYEVVECEIHPANVVCPDCGGITLEGLDYCNKCGGEINFLENE